MDLFIQLSPILITALLAFLGVVVTLFAPDTTKKKVIWCIVFAVLGVASVLTYIPKLKESMEQQQRMETRMIATENSLKEIGAELNLKKPGSLKYNTLHLAQEILEFVKTRRQKEYGTALKRYSPEEWEARTNLMIMQSIETRTLYKQMFASRVASLRGQLAANGLSNEELDRYYKNPVNLLVMEQVALSLSKLGNELD